MMKAVNSVFVGFRCPNALKEKMVAYSSKRGIHLSQLIRNAVLKLLQESHDATGDQARGRWHVQ